MNDPLILILVLIASAVSITGLVLLNRWLGGWQPARLESPAGAATCLSNDIVGFRAGETALFDQGTGAFVMEQGGDRLGLVWTRGARFVTRVLSDGDVASVDREGRTLTLKLCDYTFSRMEAVMADEAEAELWAERLNGFVRAEGGRDAQPA
jgi:hypothetical protein